MVPGTPVCNHFPLRGLTGRGPLSKGAGRFLGSLMRGYSKSFWKRRSGFGGMMSSVIALIAIFQSVPSRAAGSSMNSMEITDVSAPEAPGGGEAIRVRVRHVEGQDELLLRLAKSSSSSSRASLYRGVLRRPGPSGTLRASGDRIGDRFRVTFHGRRRGRLISMSVTSKKHSHTRQAFVPTFARFMCATSEAESVSDLSTVREVAAARRKVFTPPRVFTVSADADYEFFEQYGSDTHAEIEAIFNTTNSIYMSQIGIEVVPVQITQFSSSDQPYRSSTGSDLLSQFQNYNLESKRLQSADAYHLFTGKSLAPSGMVGLSYVGSVCQSQARFSYGLTAYYPSPIQPIIFTHELGHNLGATHTDAGIMLANLSSNPRSFSSYSINQVETYVNRYGSCLSTGSIPVDTGPGVGLSHVSLSRSGRFRAVLRAERTENKYCTIDLYGTTRKSYVSEANIGKKARKLASFPVISDGNESVRGSVKVDRTRPKRTLYLRARIECDAEKSLSSIEEISVQTRNIRSFYSSLGAAITK